jgi:hypothetical protein
MNSDTVLITAPNKKGDPTSYTWEWGKKAEKLAKSLGYRVIFIEKDNVDYDKVSSAILKYEPRLYIHLGHGCGTSIVGQNQCIITRKFTLDELLMMDNFQEIIQPLKYITGCKYMCQLDGMPDPCLPMCHNGTNVGLLKDTITVAIACYTGGQLGRCSIKYGCSSYFGEDDLLLFPTDTIKSEDIFGEVHLVYIKELLEGKSVAEAEIKMNEFEDNMITLYKKTKYISLPLLWNKIHRRVLGNKDVRIFD